MNKVMSCVGMIACMTCCAGCGFEPVAALSYPPSLSEVGPPPSLSLDPVPGGTLSAGSYSGKRFTTPVAFATAGTYRFYDCEFTQGIGVVFGGATVSRRVSLDHCRLLGGGLYFEDAGQKNWIIKWCEIRGDGQALRPKGLVMDDNTTPTPFVVEDSIVSNSNLGTPAAHVEAMQCLGGNSMRFSRVRFVTPGPYVDGVTGQTASVNNTSGNTLFESCDFLSAGAFVYTVYSNGPNVLFRNCRLVRGIAGYIFRESAVMAAYEDCTDIETGEVIK